MDSHPPLSHEQLDLLRTWRAMSETETFCCRLRVRNNSLQRMTSASRVVPSLHQCNFSLGPVRWENETWEWENSNYWRLLIWRVAPKMRTLQKCIPFYCPSEEVHSPHRQGRICSASSERFSSCLEGRDMGTERLTQSFSCLLNFFRCPSAVRASMKDCCRLS